jgi:PAS domain S-box-containing protein
MALYKHQMEKKLKERERWFSTTLRSIGDAVIATDNNGHVTFMNPVAEVLTGWKLAEVQNKKLTEIFKIINRDTRQPVDNPVAKVLSESTTVGLANHIKLIARNGIETSIDDSASPIKDDYGALLGVILVFRDVTEREKAEKELKEADRRKDEFLAMLAHEMRNPLAPIRNAVQILDLARPKDPLIEKHGKIIDRQVTHMARLLEDLLDVSRIAQGKITLKKEQFDLRTVVLQAVEIAAHTAQDRPLEIKCVSTPPEPLWIDGDYTRLEQVFGNLLNNAIKYTDRGQIIVTLKREKTCNGEGAWATVAVRDTGIGIPPKLLPGIFDLFTQVDQSLDRSRGGLGIGLTMVKRLTEMHGGWVKAYSAGSGTGSEFIVRLPLTQ